MESEAPASMHRPNRQSGWLITSTAGSAVAPSDNEARPIDPRPSVQVPQERPVQIPGRDAIAGERSAAASRAEQVNDAVRLANATGGRIAEAEPAARPLVSPVVTVESSSSVKPSVTLGSFLSGETVSTPTSTNEPSIEARATTSVWRGLSAMVNQRGGVMHMRLDPPELGELRIQMTMARGMVSATFQASTHAAQSIIEQHMTTLRSALESHGLSVDRLSVSAPSPSNSAQLSNHGSGDQHQSDLRERHDAGQGESRGRGDDASADDRRGFRSLRATASIDPDLFSDSAATLTDQQE